MINLLDPFFAAFSRLTVARGITFPELAERLKSHYVRAGMTQAEGKITDSKLSVLTGLQRRDIVRLRDFTPKPPRPNPLTGLVALWQTDPEFTRGTHPKRLPRQGETASFDALARRVRRDVHSRTMLDQLLAAGTVTLNTETQIVTLVQSSYQPLAGSEDQLTYLAHNLGDHLDAATQNVVGHMPPHFERAVHYGGLTEAQVATLRRTFDNGQMALLETLSKQAAEMKASNDGEGSQRFRAGGYFFEQTEDQQ